MTTCFQVIWRNMAVHLKHRYRNFATAGEASRFVRDLRHDITNLEVTVDENTPRDGAVFGQTFVSI